MNNIFMINEGSRVMGKYYGSQFEGTVSYRRFHTINMDEMVFHIDLDQKIKTLSGEAESICLTVLHTTGISRTNDCQLYL